MKLNTFQKIGIILGFSVLTFIATNILITKYASLENSTLIQGHFKSIEKFQLKNKVSFSYNIYIEEESDFFKIVPEYVNCFAFDKFKNDVDENQIINLYINKENGLRSTKLKKIVAIDVNGKDYLDQKCINKEIRTSKYEVLTILILSLAVGLFIYFIKRKNRV